jgi:hypothetical protein
MTNPRTVVHAERKTACSIYPVALSSIGRRAKVPMALATVLVQHPATVCRKIAAITAKAARAREDARDTRSLQLSSS